MDCFAVSTSQGIQQAKWHPRALLMAVLFGLFQGGMPVIGYYAGCYWADFFSRWAPWIALTLLAWIGGKMIWESLHEDEETTATADWSIRNLLALSVATSIDALSTGVIFIPCPEQLWVGVGVIALCSLLFALCGYTIGVTLGKRFTFNAELLGGIILVGIGIKIFIEGKGWELLCL